MLGAWQIGDADLMHKYYADDMTMISGAWEPPLLGWANYARAYQAQRARMQGSRLDRINTYTKVMGDTAWVAYQWKFAGQVDGQRMDALGHTTLVLQKRDGNWLIVMNHTSAIPSAAPAAVAPAPATGSAKPAGPGA
jgi:ketosteroid isomerase-like protein